MKSPKKFCRNCYICRNVLNKDYMPDGQPANQQQKTLKGLQTHRKQRPETIPDWTKKTPTTSRIENLGFRKWNSRGNSIFENGIPEGIPFSKMEFHLELHFRKPEFLILGVVRADVNWAHRCSHKIHGRAGASRAGATLCLRGYPWGRRPFSWELTRSITNYHF